MLYHPADKWFAEQPVKAVGHLMQVLLGRAVCLCYPESARVLWAELWHCCWLNHCRWVQER